MSLVLDLTPQQERQVEIEAASEGLSVKEWALRRLVGEEQDLLSEPDGPPITSEEFGKYRPVRLDGRPLSETLIEDRR